MSPASTLQPKRHRGTRAAFHRAAAAGAFGGDDIQLRHGEVVCRVSPRGPRRAAVVQRLVNIVPARLAQAGGTYQARIQDRSPAPTTTSPNPTSRSLSAVTTSATIPALAA